MKENSKARGMWRNSLVIFLSIFVVYALTVDLDGISNDAHSAQVGAWRIATSGEPWLDEVDLNTVKEPKVYLWIDEAANGHTVAFRSPGVIAVGVPAYWLDHRILGDAGYSHLPGALTAALLAALACLCFLLCLRGLLQLRAAVAATLALAFTTPMWTVAGNSLWTHPLTTMSILGMAWSARTERWWLLGVFGGIGLWGRLHVAVIVAVLGLGIAISRNAAWIAVVVGTVSSLMMGLASVWSRWMYGTWSPSGGYPTGYITNIGGRNEGGWHEHVVNQLGLWVSPDRGMLLWTPVLVLLLPALARSWHSLPDWSRWLAVGGLVYIVIQGQLNLFTGGDGYYGYRLQLELLACVAPAYALSLPYLGDWAKRLLGPLLGLQFAAMALGATSEGFYVFKAEAWTDSSLALALRTFPALSGWLFLMALVGYLAGRVWEERTARSAGPLDQTHQRLGGHHTRA